MAKSGLTHIDVGPELTRTEWESEETHALINGTSFPVAPVERQLFYRNDLHEWYIYTGSAWVSLQGAGGGLVVHDNAFHSPDFEEEGYADLAIAAHRTAAVHVADQPPDVHDNAKHSPDFEEEGVAATQIETHRTTAVHVADQPPDVHDNAKHSPDFEEEGVAATQIETHRTTAVHVADQPPDVHDNTKHTPTFEEEGVAATQIETHRTAAEHTQDQPSNFLKLADTPAAYTGQAGKYPKVNVGESALEFGTPGGAGDMLKSVYDTDDDGVVDNSEKLEGSTKVQVQTHNPAEHGNEAHDPDFASAAALSSHQATVNAHAAAVAATANRIALRDASARAKFAAPAAAGDVLIKGTAITDVEHGSRGSALHTDSHGQNTDKVIKDADGDTKIQVEEAADEDTVRMDVAGVEAFRLSSVGIQTLPKQSSARAHLDNGAAVQTIPHAAWTRIMLDAEDFDIQNEFNSTRKSGTADATEASKLHDADGGFAPSDVGAWIWNTTDDTYTQVSGFVDSGELDLADDIMVNGEGYILFHGTFTVTEAGHYFCGGGIYYESPVADKYVSVAIYKNGANVAIGRYHSSSTSPSSAGVFTVLALSVNDVIDLRSYHATGVGETIKWAAGNTFLNVTKLM